MKPFRCRFAFMGGPLDGLVIQKKGLPRLHYDVASLVELLRGCEDVSQETLQTCIYRNYMTRVHGSNGALPIAYYAYSRERGFPDSHGAFQRFRHWFEELCHSGIGAEVESLKADVVGARKRS
jgi:hypothetical protein